MHAVLPGSLQLTGQCVARAVSILEDSFEAFRGHGFHAHQCAFDGGAVHGVEVRYYESSAIP